MDAHAAPPIMPLIASGIPAGHVGYASGVRSLNDDTHASEHDARAGACLSFTSDLQLCHSSKASAHSKVASSSAHVFNAPAQVAAPTPQHQHCHSIDSTVADVHGHPANLAALPHRHSPAAQLTLSSLTSFAGVQSAPDLQMCAPRLLVQGRNPEGNSANSSYPAKRRPFC